MNKGLKESFRKLLVSLKRRPHIIPLLVFALAFLVYSLNLMNISDTTAKIQGKGMGLCGFATMLYVTHDQTEALTLADRIVCMSMGHVQQVGTPLELYDTPANLFVASFIGLPPMNFFNVTVREDALVNSALRVPLSEAERGLLKDHAGREIVLGVRPEDIVAGGETLVKVFSNENLGMNTLVHGHLLHGEKTEDRITCKLRGWCDYKAGDTVPVTFVRKHFFDKETTDAIREEA